MRVCQSHSQEITHLCLADDCKENLFLCESCQAINVHKHSKTDIRLIAEIKDKLRAVWEPKESLVEPYFQKIAQFYEGLRKEINKLIDEDHKQVEGFLVKVQYHHLPYEANSQAYLEFTRDEYDRLDRHSILNLLNEADNGQLNKHLDKQKEISNFLDLELKKVNDKILTLKYVLPVLSRSCCRRNSKASCSLPTSQKSPRWPPTRSSSRSTASSTPGACSSASPNSSTAQASTILPPRPSTTAATASPTASPSSRPATASSSADSAPCLWSTTTKRSFLRRDSTLLIRPKRASSSTSPS